MDRKQIDAAMMEEVIADRDVESFQRPKAARRAVSAPEPAPVPTHMLATPRPVLSTYPAAKLEKGFRRWAVGIAGVAAGVVIGIGILFFSPGGIDRTMQGSSEAWTSIRSAAASVRGSSPVKSESVPLSSNLDVQAAELPNTGSSRLSPSGDADAINTVIVQPGESLRQVILRTMGDYNGDAIEQIRKLNPDLVDLEHLKAGQVIRFPWVAGPARSAVPSGGAGRGGKN
jgi:hypothetical protein